MIALRATNKSSGEEFVIVQFLGGDVGQMIAVVVDAYGGIYKCPAAELDVTPQVISGFKIGNTAPENTQGGYLDDNL